MSDKDYIFITVGEELKIGDEFLRTEEGYYPQEWTIIDQKFLDDIEKLYKTGKMYQAGCKPVRRKINNKPKVEPNCYKCIYRGTIPGDAHSLCRNFKAKVTGMSHGIKNGWFFWPINFDPVWLVSCNGFKETESKNE